MSDAGPRAHHQTVKQGQVLERFKVSTGELPWQWRPIAICGTPNLSTR